MFYPVAQGSLGKSVRKAQRAHLSIYCVLLKDTETWFLLSNGGSKWKHMTTLRNHTRQYVIKSSDPGEKNFKGRSDPSVWLLESGR